MTKTTFMWTKWIDSVGTTGVESHVCNHTWALGHPVPTVLLASDQVSLSTQLRIMMTRAAAIGLCFVGVVTSNAQLTTNPAAAGTSLASDTEWASIKNLGHAKGVEPTVAVELIGEADRLKEFYTKYPTHVEAKNAKCLEGIALVGAWLAGDTAQDARRQQVVADVRKDNSASPTLRAELIAFADNVAVAKRDDLTREDKHSAYEQVARSIVSGFPDLPNGYEALLHLAHDGAEARAPALAREVASNSKAPAWVRDEAQVLVNRYALLGKSVRDVAGVKSSAVVPSDHSIYIYSWARSSEVSIRRAKALAASAGQTSVFIGVCLDPAALDASRLWASEAGLPGEQILDPDGVRGTVASRLFLTEPGLYYRADSSGILRSVSVQNELSPTLLETKEAAAIRTANLPLMDPTKPALAGILTSSDPNTPPPFVAGTQRNVPADPATAAISPALISSIGDSYLKWRKTNEGDAFSPSLLFINGYPNLTVTEMVDETPATSARRLRAMINGCAFLLETGAFETAVIRVAGFNPKDPEAVATRGTTVLRTGFQNAIKRYGKSATLSTALAAVLTDEGAIKQVCSELGLR